MSTAAERRALWFLAGVITLGGGARAVDARRAEASATRADPSPLTHQLAAIDSARRRQGHTRRAGLRDAAVGARRDSRQLPAGAPAPPAPPRVEPSYVAPPLVPSYMPPSYGPLPPSQMAATPQGATRWFQAHPLDLDVATALDLEALPGVGPSLARRIVAERDAHGPFGSLRGLERVRGIGPALVERLKPLVLFSGVPLPGTRSPVKAPSRGRHRASRG